MAGKRKHRSALKKPGQKSKSAIGPAKELRLPPVSTPKPIELIISHDKDGQFEANVGIRWAISSQTLKYLIDHDVKDPYVLIVVMNNFVEVDRFVYQLRQEMTYLAFRRPGINTICSTIIWKNEGGKSVRDIVLSKDNGDWKTSVMSRNRDSTYMIDHSISRDINQLDYEARVNVDVPKKMFAPEPSKIVKSLGNYYSWNHSARNECQLRDRALITLLSLPIYVLSEVTWWIVRKLAIIIVIIALSIWGYRNIDYKPLISIRHFDARDVWYDLQPSLWWSKKVDKGGRSSYVDRGLIFMFINPPILLAAVSVGLFTRFIGGNMASFWIVFLCIMMAVPVFVLSVIAGDRFNSKKKEWSKTKTVRELGVLVCKTTDGLKADISALPQNRRTVRLRYSDLKSRVCRPFAEY